MLSVSRAREAAVGSAYDRLGGLKQLGEAGGGEGRVWVGADSLPSGAKRGGIRARLLLWTVDCGLWITQQSQQHHRITLGSSCARPPPPPPQVSDEGLRALVAAAPALRALSVRGCGPGVTRGVAAALVEALASRATAAAAAPGTWRPAAALSGEPSFTQARDAHSCLGGPLMSCHSCHFMPYMPFMSCPFMPWWAALLTSGEPSVGARRAL